MKKLIFLTALITIVAIVTNAQTKKDGTPDMRFKSNKELYGNNYSIPSYSTTSYSVPSCYTTSYSIPSYTTTSYSTTSFSTPSYSTTSYTTPSYSTKIYTTPSYSMPSYSQPKQERNYNNGGQLKIQNGYTKSNGTYVQPHLKTTPDNIKWNNKDYWEIK